MSKAFVIRCHVKWYKHFVKNAIKIFNVVIKCRKNAKLMMIVKRRAIYVYDAMEWLSGFYCILISIKTRWNFVVIIKFVWSKYCNFRQNYTVQSFCIDMSWPILSFYTQIIIVSRKFLKNVNWMFVQLSVQFGMDVHRSIAYSVF